MTLRDRSMDIDELINEWKNFNLMEEEREAFITLNAEEVRVIKGQLDYCLVGKLLASRIISKMTIKNALQGAWKTRNNFSVDVLSKNVFLFKFESKEDREWITRNESWLFDRNLLVLEVPEENQRTVDLEFKKVDFWLRIINLPIGYQNEMVARRIGNNIWNLLEMNNGENSVTCGNSIRIRARLDISRLLRRGFMLKTDGIKEAYWITIRYGRILDFCFQCGKIGHVAKECMENKSSQEVNNKNKFEFGSWMKFQGFPCHPKVLNL